MTTEKEPNRATSHPPAASSVGPTDPKSKGAPPADDDAIKLPTLTEMEKELGDGEGSIRLDVNLETGEVKKVRVDAKGKESK